MRSKLFVPASRPELFAKAMAGPADAISFDLEDAVDEARKADARRELGRFLRSLPRNSGKTIIVRVNALATPHFEDDLHAIACPALDIVNLPKPGSADHVKACAGALAKIERVHGLDDIGILVNIETPRALRLAAELAAASPRVVGLQAGWGDLIEPLDIDRYNPAMIQQLQLQIRIAAAEAGVWAFDGAWANIQDAEGFRREAEAARRLGYLGKSAIHPSQVPLANEVFRPTDAEIAHALKVVAAGRSAREKGIGAWTVDGKMVDAPFVRRAEAILSLARKLGLVAPEEGSLE
jgi:citrate lyase beta subunit